MSQARALFEKVYGTPAVEAIPCVTNALPDEGADAARMPIPHTQGECSNYEMYQRGLEPWTDGDWYASRDIESLRAAAVTTPPDDPYQRDDYAAYPTPLPTHTRATAPGRDTDVTGSRGRFAGCEPGDVRREGARRWAAW